MWLDSTCLDIPGASQRHGKGCSLIGVGGSLLHPMLASHRYAWLWIGVGVSGCKVLKFVTFLLHCHWGSRRICCAWQLETAFSSSSWSCDLRSQLFGYPFHMTHSLALWHKDAISITNESYVSYSIHRLTYLNSWTVTSIFVCFEDND